MTKQGLSGGFARQKSRSAGFHFHLHEPETALCCGNATEIHFRPSFLKSEAMWQKINPHRRVFPDNLLLSFLWRQAGLRRKNAAAYSRHTRMQTDTTASCAPLTASKFQPSAQSHNFYLISSDAPKPFRPEAHPLQKGHSHQHDRYPLRLFLNLQS